MSAEQTGKISAFDQWVELVNRELKQEQAAQKLVWEIEPGLVLSAFQHEVSDKAAQFADQAAAVMSIQDAQFSVGRQFNQASGELNKQMLNCLNQGITALQVHVASTSATELLQDIEPAHIQLEYFGPYKSDDLEHIASKIKSSGLSNYKGGYYLKHPEHLGLGLLDLPELKEHVMAVESHLPLYQSIYIDAGAAANAGASISEQIAYALYLGHTYFIELLGSGLKPEQVAGKFHFHFNQGNVFLGECVKIRTFVSLWKRLISAYHPSFDGKTSLSSGISSVYQSAMDRHNNLLRFTAGTMSAIISGSQCHYNPSFTSYLAETGEMEARLSTNVALVLAEESFLTRVQNTTYGSYVFDNLQYALADKAWQLLQEWDAQGNFRDLYSSNKVQDCFKQSALRIKEDFASGKIKLIGVNKYPNAAEGALDLISSKEVSHPLAFPELRLAETIENQKFGS